MYFSSSSGTEILPSQFEQLVEEGKVEKVQIVGYPSGGTVRIRVIGSKVTENRWPQASDYYFSYISYDDVSETIKTYNSYVKESKAADPDFEGVEIVRTEGNPATPFLEKILPYMSIIIFVVITIIIIRMMTTKSSGANAFGKSKAKIMSKSVVKFADIAGADEEKEETREIVEFLKNPLRFKALGARIPKGVLLVGQPGTGKTLLARAVAGESNVPFFSISGSDFVELYVGVGASRVRDLFETAKRRSPCIVFIDEIDAVGRQRGAGLGGGNDEREQTLNQLLVEMDGFESNEGIIVLAATNRADVLDPALLRPGRFDRQIYVNVPDVRGREGIIAIHAKGKPIDSDVDFNAIARLTSGFTGADIENFLNEAAIIAARNNRVSISMEDITEGINKVLMGPQKKSRVITEKDKRITAYHEAGHAIVTKKLESGDNVHEVSIIPRGMAMGYTSIRPADDEEGMTYSRLVKKISTLMGGRVTEEIIFNDITTGASSDINRATEIAKRMVTEWGMSKRLGFINLGKSKEVFIGRDYQVQNTYSDATAAIIDEEIKRILDECYQEAKRVIKQNMDILENMAQLLLERETIYLEEIDMIMAGENYKKVSKMLDKKDKKRKQEQEEKRKEQEKQQALQVQTLKEQAAEALRNAGVLSVQEFEMIKKDGEDLKKKLSEKSDKEKSAEVEVTKPTAKVETSTTKRKTSTAKTSSGTTKKTTTAKPAVKKPATAAASVKTTAKKSTKTPTKTTAKKPTDKGKKE